MRPFSRSALRAGARGGRRVARQQAQNILGDRGARKAAGKSAPAAEGGPGGATRVREQTFHDNLSTVLKNNARGQRERAHKSLQSAASLRTGRMWCCGSKAALLSTSPSSTAPSITEVSAYLAAADTASNATQPSTKSEEIAVKVVIRVRPFISREGAGEASCIETPTPATLRPPAR